ncbi:MAG: nicotinate-nucleotide adenylyltransferase [Candidatus Omnitrophota bacterium]
MKRIGVLGGTFNPIHIGHLAVAEMAKERLQLEKVIFVPSYLPVHKNPKIVAPSKDRHRMVRLAIQNNPDFDISDFEIKKKGKSYTVDTMWYFRRLYPENAELFFIIGGDTLPQVKKWKYIEDILKVATFIVVNRPGQFKKTNNIRHYSVSMPGIDISSSYVRRRIAIGKSVKYFVPDKVIQYIKRNKLYGCKS